MIVRVIGEGQYEVDEGLVERLNALDRQALDALERNEETELDRCLDGMAKLVREGGTRLSDDVLTPSEIIVPPSDLTLEETRKLISEQGFIPDPPVRA
ncbi:MAG: hypothetical protein M3Q92_12945 [Actinomycetota bacterium]|nr:hypothetical protein [Actinomycetota bacterium]